jgi:hypothetical protein
MIPIFASTRRPSWLWRFLNRNRAWCVTPDPPRDLRTRELQRRGDNVLEAQSFWRVRKAWFERGVVDASGFVKAALLTPTGNVVPLRPRGKAQGGVR